jgi:hypothetical protein
MEKFCVVAGLAFAFSGAAVAAAGIGPGLSLTAVAAAEFIDFVQPSAITCARRDLDFGPPPGCDDGPQPHNRTAQLTSLDSSSSTSTFVAASNSTVYDADYFQLKDWA